MYIIIENKILGFNQKVISLYFHEGRMIKKKCRFVLNKISYFFFVVLLEDEYFKNYNTSKFEEAGFQIIRFYIIMSTTF